MSLFEDMSSDVPSMLRHSTAAVSDVPVTIWFAPPIQGRPEYRSCKIHLTLEIDRTANASGNITVRVWQA